MKELFPHPARVSSNGWASRAGLPSRLCDLSDDAFERKYFHGLRGYTRPAMGTGVRDVSGGGYLEELRICLADERITAQVHESHRWWAVTKRQGLRVPSGLLVLGIKPVKEAARTEDVSALWQSERAYGVNRLK